MLLCGCCLEFGSSSQLRFSALADGSALSGARRCSALQWCAGDEGLIPAIYKCDVEFVPAKPGYLPYAEG